MKDEIKVSAIITAYNAELFLGEAIESVLAQTRPVDEIILIDDGSVDTTAEIAASYKEYVTYAYQENQGPGAARNAGLALATGDLIAFLDADDLWLPEKTAKQVAYLHKNPEVIVVSGQKIWQDEIHDDEWVMTYPEYAVHKFRRELLVNNIVGNPSMALIRSDAIAQAGHLDAGLPWGQDWEWWIRLAQVGPFGYLSEPVIVYRWHSDNVSHKKGLQRLACFEHIAHRSVARFAPARWRLVLWLRVVGRFSFERAKYLSDQEGERFTALREGCLSLVVAPFDGAKGKLILIFRALFGEQRYQQLKLRLRGEDA